MGNLSSYSGLSTKIRAMQGRLLSPEDYRELASMPDVPGALLWLKNHPGYRELFSETDEASLHRGQIEKMLTGAVYSDFRSIYLFADAGQRRFLDLYFHRYEVALLKRCLRMVFDHRDEKPDLKIFEAFFRRHSRIDLAKLSCAKNIREFTGGLEGSICREALLPLEKLPAPTLWDYETAIDLFYFKWFFESGMRLMKGSQQKHFLEAYGTKMDLLNIMWICRSRRYFHMAPAEIYAHLIPVRYRLSPAETAALAEAGSEEAFAAAVRATWYGRHHDSFTAGTLQESCRQIRSSIQRRAAVRDPCSVAVIISYLYEKEHEISKITTALEGVRYGLPREETLKLVRG